MQVLPFPPVAKLTRYSLLVLFLIFASCSRSQKDESVERSQGSELIKPEFAIGFEAVVYENGVKDLIVKTPYQGATQGACYRLYQDSQPESVEGSLNCEGPIKTPVATLVSTSTTHIPLLEYLGAEDRLVGFPNTDYISSIAVRKRVDQGLVQDLGSELQMNIELVVSLQPDILMAYTVSGDLGDLARIKDAGIPVILNAEFLENHPLGRAEWIKFMASFLGREDKADSVFSKIRDNYMRIKRSVDTVRNRPTIMTGVVYGDTWFLPGGRNYAARLFEDAGGRYIWEDDLSTGFLELGFESVYERAENADFWIGTASYNSLTELRSGDARYADFLAFKQGQAYHYNKWIGETGGNQYLELGYLRPDLILGDLVRILHPGLLKDSVFTFYQPLSK